MEADNKEGVKDAKIALPVSNPEAVELRSYVAPNRDRGGSVCAVPTDRLGHESGSASDNHKVE